MSNVPEENRPEACPGPATETAGTASACAGCPNQQICASGAPAAIDPDLDPILARLSQIKHKLVVLSGKGGVGKSTTTAMIARALALDENKEIGLLDVDICGPSQPRAMGTAANSMIHSSGSGISPIFVEDNLCVMSVGFLLEDTDQAVIWRGPKKRTLIHQFLKDVDWQALDYLVIDTPPGTSDEHLDITQYLLKSFSAAAVIVTTPQEVAIMDVRKQISFCQKIKMPIIGIVENMSAFSCPKCSVTTPILLPSSGGAARLSQETGIPLLSSLPLDPVLTRCVDEGRNYLTEYPDSVTTSMFRALTKDITDYFTSQ